MPKKRSAAARARQRARSAGYVAMRRDERDSRNIPALMRPEGLAPGAGSVYDPSRAIADVFTDRPGVSRQGVTYRGAPAVPASRAYQHGKLRDQTRARDLKIVARDGTVLYDARDRKRRVTRCDNSPGCLCAGCVNDRRVARQLAEDARRQAEGGWA